MVVAYPQASLRRFDLKVKFDYLLPAQIVALFRRYCAEMGYAEPDPQTVAYVAYLNGITPGDFAAVSRRNRFSRLAGPTAVLAALREEAALKEPPNGKIGFG